MDLARVAPALPERTACPNPKCFNTTPEATTVCRFCGTDKTAPRRVECRYHHGQPCDCGGRGLCLDVA